LKEITMARPYLPSFFGRGDDPFGSLFREVQKTFEDFSQRTPFARFSADTLSPKIDIAESKDAIDVTAELPGVDEKDLDVTLANGMLTIGGEKKTERDEQDKDKNWYVVERSYGSFSRTIPLSFDPDPAKYLLAGSPVIIASQMPDIATGATPIAFGNWKAAYMVVTRKATTMQVDPYSAGYCILYKWEARVGGSVVCPNAARLLRIS
jgi:HSP20 family molecular chaperone IbpA